MTSSSKFRRIFPLTLVLAFFLSACSGEDESVDGMNLADKTSVEKETAEARGKPARKTREETMPDGFEKSYVKAMMSLRKRDYESAREDLVVALSWNNEEQLDLKIPGRRSGPYLPHFFLGQIAYTVGDCKAAVAHWNTSMGQNVVQKTPSFKDLEEGMQECSFSR